MKEVLRSLKEMPRAGPVRQNRCGPLNSPCRACARGPTRAVLVACCRFANQLYCGQARSELVGPLGSKPRDESSKQRSLLSPLAHTCCLVTPLEIFSSLKNSARALRSKRIPIQQVCQPRARRAKRRAGRSTRRQANQRAITRPIARTALCYSRS